MAKSGAKSGIIEEVARFQWIWNEVDGIGRGQFQNYIKM